MSSTGIPSALQRRLAVYEYIQEQHRLQPQLSVIVSPHVDPRIAIDLADLPRLTLTVIVANSDKQTRTADFRRYQVESAIQVVLEGDLDPQRKLQCDFLVINAVECAGDSFVRLHHSSRYKYLIITGDFISEHQSKIEQRAVAFGWQCVANDPFVYQRPSKRILVITNLYPPQELGGYGRSIYDFANRLADRGHEVKVLTSNSEYLGSITDPESTVDRRLRLLGTYDGGMKHVESESEVKEIIDSNDQLIKTTIQNFQPDICFVGNVDFLSHKIFQPFLGVKIPIVHHLGFGQITYGMQHVPKSSLYQLVAASQFVKESVLNAGFPSTDIRVVYPGALVDLFRHIKPAPRDKLRIIYASLLVPVKGPDIMLKALKKLHDQGIDFECSMAGDAFHESYRVEIQRAIEYWGLSEKVKLLGVLSRENLIKLYQKCNVLIFPSTWQEPFGISQVEGMAAGMLVVTSGTGGASEIVEHGISGLRFKPSDPDDLCNVLQHLVTVPEYWQKLAQAGRERAAQIFDIERSVDQLEEIFSCVMMRKLQGLAQSKNVLPEVSRSLPIASSAIHVEPSQIHDIPSTVTAQLKSLQLTPNDHQALTYLNQTRRSLADYLRRHPLDRLQTEWNQDLHKAYRAVWHSGLKNSPPDDADRAFIEQIATQASGDPRDSKTFQALLIAALYLYPHQLNIDPARIIVPNVFVPTYMEFMFESPRLFKTIGEVDRYHEYFARWTQFIHQRTQANPNGNVERYLCQTYANAANLTPTYFSQRDPVTIQTQRAQIIEQYLKSQTTQLDYEFPPRPANRQKIRFGILSLNFNPSAETFTVLPIFEQLDRTKFEIHLFAFQSNNSETERYCRQHADRFTHLIHNHADRLVRMIRGADLDILLIGSNITARSYPITFVSAHRLARVQVSGISSSVTTALHNMDYYIGATLTTPPATAQRYYTETLVTLEGSGLCFSFPPVTDEATIAFDRTQLGLGDSTTVFMSGANFRKINPELRDTWAQLLARVPDSILVIYPFGPNWGLHPNLEMPFFNQMQLALQRHGVDLKRLLLIKTMPSVADVRSCLSQADVYLDSFPYSGAASAIDPLTVGVPFVSLEGREQRERQSSSLLHELGLPELVTSNESDYLDLAVKLASDRPLREQFRQRLLRQMSNNPPFLDKLGYAHKIEQLLTQLMSAWRPAASSTTVNLPSSANQAASTPIEEPVQML